MKPTPILFFSDSPSLPTGLARITKDLAYLVSGLPEFRVGTLGRGGQYSSKLPFAQYNFGENEQWGEGVIQWAWEDFAREERGIVMSIWDLSRLTWFAKPRMQEYDPQLYEFLRSGVFQRWAYVPVDSYGVGGKLTGQMADALSGFDRKLTYSAFGKEVIERTTNEETEWLPHGFNAKEFMPRDKTPGRMKLNVGRDDLLIGCVMTNQSRKDWATAFGTLAFVKNVQPKAKLWCHVDVMERYWNLKALAEDFGLMNSVRITTNGAFNSKELSYMYSACDLTILPSLGEGFGYPIVESMACGVPVLHVNYGGGAELLPDNSWLVPAETQRLDGMWNTVRPVLNPKDWADRVLKVAEDVKKGGLDFVCTSAVEHLAWEKLWPATWQKWFLRGLQ